MKYLLRKTNYYIITVLLTSLPAIFLSIQASAQGIDFTRSTDFFIKLRGDNNTYSFVGKYLDGRYNSRLRRFEFHMPLNEVYASDGATEMNVFNTVFASNGTMAANAEGFRLFAYLNESVPNFTDFRNGRTLNLEGECTIGGVKYKMPVLMRVRYQDGNLFYSLDTEISSAFQNIILPAASAGVQLRMIQFLMRDGIIKVLLEG